LATARDETGPDGFSSAQSFLANVRAPMSASEIVRDHGGHNFGTWSAEFPAALQWMNQRLVDAETHRHNRSAGARRTPSASAQDSGMAQ
jgi:hypothetical protein